MHSRTFLLLLASSLVACSGDDTNTQDGGPDATTDVAQNKDSATDGTTTTDGSNDATTTDSGGDAAPTDAATDASDGGTVIGDGGTFACGTATCNLNTQYCSKLTVGPDGGLPLDAGKFDGGNKEVDTCQGYPAQCTADGGTPSCACVQGTCGGCTDTSGAIIVTCP